MGSGANPAPLGAIGSNRFTDSYAQNFELAQLSGFQKRELVRAATRRLLSDSA